MGEPPNPAASASERRRGAQGVLLAAGIAMAMGAISPRLAREPTPFASRVTTEGSRARVTVGGAVLDIGPRSEVLLGGDDGRHAVSVTLERGQVECEIAIQDVREGFAVNAGEARVRAVDARFSVNRDANGAHVEVKRGLVEVEAHGDVQTAGEGQRWPAVPFAPSFERRQDVASTSDVPMVPTSTATPPDAEPQPRSSAPRQAE